MSGPINLLEPFSRSIRKSGKSKVIVNIKADPLIVNLDDKAAALMIAEEARQGIIEDIKSIPEKVKPETFAKRERNVRQWATGKVSPSMKKRYTGGRIGFTPPQISDRLFIDSGRLLKSFVLTPRKRSNGESVVTLNVAANRFEPESFGGYALLEKNVFARLRSYVSWFSPQGLQPKASARLDSVLDKIAGLAIATSKAQAQRNAMDFLRAGQKVLSALSDIAKSGLDK